MTTRITRPSFIAMAISLSALSGGFTAAAEMDHSQMNHGSAPSAMGGMDHSQPTRERTSQNQTPTADHGKMDHGAMDHSKMNHGSADAARTTSRTPIPVLTDADRKAAFPPLPGLQIHDSAIRGFFLLDQLEYQDANDGSALAWDASGWLGGDIDRVWFRSEGDRTNGVTEDAELQLLYGRSIGPWWDVVAGVRQDFKPESPQTWAAFGFQGLALYNFEAEATAFIGVGSGLANTELGLRLRYEIVRQFAPYIGVSWSRSYGNTADLVREEDGDVSEARFVAGIRVWF